MITILRNTAVSCLVAALSAWSHVDCSQVTVRLYDAVFVTENAVCLGDIAELEGPSDAVNRLKSIRLAATSEKGIATEISVEDIRHHIPPEITANVCDTRVTYIAAWEGYCESGCLLPAIQSRYTDLAGDSLSARIGMSGARSVLRGPESPPVRFSMLDLETVNPGQQVVSFMSCDGNGKVSRHHLNVMVDVTGMLAFPVDVIKRGEVIEADDFERRTVELKSRHLTNLVLKPERLVGLEASRYLSPDSAIRWDHVTLPPVVRKGDGVQVVLEADNFAIKANAEALESGSAGDEIWVRLENNGKRMRAVVVGADQVTLAK